MSFSVPNPIQEEEAAIQTLRGMRQHQLVRDPARARLRDAVVKAIRGETPVRTSEFVVRVAADSARLNSSYRITVYNKKTRVVDVWNWVGMMTLTKLYGKKSTATNARDVAELIASGVLNGPEPERFAMLGMDPVNQGPPVPAAHVRLVSSDGNVFIVDRAVAKVSQVITDMLEDLENTDDAIHLNVDGPVLAKVLEYCNVHAAHANVEDVHAARAINAATDAAFIHAVDNTMLFELISAANFMNIQGLLNLACQVVADTIKGKTPEQIRQEFGIVNDFTPEEEAEVRAEYAWAFE